MCDFLRKLFGCESEEHRRLPPFTRPYYFVYVNNKSYPDLFTR